MGDMPTGAILGAPSQWGRGWLEKELTQEAATKTLAETRVAYRTESHAGLELESNGDGKGGEGR